MTTIKANAAIHVTAIATARTRMNLGLHHLFAACRCTAQLHAIEQEYSGQPFGSWWEEILHCALGVATLSVAALESYANEMYFEASIIGDALPPAAATELVALIDKESVLRKYSMALAVRTGKTLNLGCATLQDADALIRLRNAVVHFRPEWFGEKEKHDKLSVRLKGRFEHSKVLPNDPLFPRAWATASFSQWALRSAVGFLDYFYGEIGLPCPLNGFRERLSQLSGNVL